MRTQPRQRGTRRFFGAGILLLAAALVSGGVATPVEAQEPRSDTLPVFDLDSLVVSVLRTPVRMGESAYPISVSGVEELRRGKTGMFLEEALEGLPGVQVQNRYNYAVGERVTIRGFGARAQFGVRGIQVMVDGIPATLPDGQSTLDHVDIASLGRVEALRGPASALYGNAAGGVLRFQTEIPSAVPIRQELSAIGGSDGMLRLQSTTTGTAGETSYLLSLNRLSYDGFRSHESAGSYGGADRMHVNGRLERPLGPGRLGITVNYLDLDSENPGALTRDLLEENSEGIVDLYIDHQTGKEVQQGQLGVSWTGPVGGLTTEAVVYGIARDFLNPIPFRVIDVDRVAGGARVILGDSDGVGDGFRWRGGVEVDLQDDDRQEFSNSSGQRGDLGLDQQETVWSTGLFYQGTLPVHERVDLVGGLRYDRFNFEAEDRFLQDGVDASGDRTMDAWSPSVGIHVEASESLDVFSNYSTFFETPTTVELANRPDAEGGFNPELDPQTGWSIEAGVRGELDDRLTYEVTGFAMQLENELIPFEIPGEEGVTYFRNAGESSRQGVEAVLRARLHERLTGQLSYAYTDARFDEYVVDGESLEDNKVPGLAPQQAQATLRYHTGTWYLELGAEHTDRVPVNDANAAFADDYTLLDLRVGADEISFGGFDFSPFAGVRNLTDELYSASLTVNAFGGRFYEPGPGRTLYFGLSTGWASR